jgi:hypothetical protein
MEPGAYVKVLVVDASITNQYKQHTIKLSTTRKIDDVDSLTVSGAKLTVFTGDSSIQFIEVDTIPGLYLSSESFSGVPGSSYKLQINDLDINNDSIFESYSAEALMPDALAIDSITYEYYDDFKSTGIKLWAQEPSSLNYYNFKAWVNDTLVSDTLFEYQVRDDELVNGIYILGTPFQFLQDERADEHIKVGDKLTLEIENIDYEYYQYLNSARDEYSGYNPLFGGLPANVYTNVSGDLDVIGIFRVFTSNKASVIVTELDRGKK